MSAGERYEATLMITQSDDVAILEHQAHQPMRPVECDRRHVEQAKQMSGWSRIYYDAGKATFRERVAEQ